MNFCLRAARRIVTSPGPSIRQRPGSAGHPCLAARFHSRAIGGIGISIAVGRRRAQSAPILIAPEALGRRGSALAAAAPLFGRLGFLFGLDRLEGSIVTGGFDLFGRWRLLRSGYVASRRPLRELLACLSSCAGTRITKQATRTATTCGAIRLRSARPRSHLSWPRLARPKVQRAHRGRRSDRLRACLQNGS